MIDYALKIQKITSSDYQEMFVVLDSLNTTIGIAKDFKCAYSIMKMYKEYIFNTYKLKNEAMKINKKPSQNEKIDLSNENFIEELLVSLSFLMKEEFTYKINENVISEIIFQMNPPQDGIMFSKNEIKTIHSRKILILFENMSSHTPAMKKKILSFADENPILESLFPIDTIDKKSSKKIIND